MNIWILCHYAVPPSLGGINRHYYFKRYLEKMGHTVRIFTSSHIHNFNINMIEGKELYLEKEVDGEVYTFVRSSNYRGNGISRLFNLVSFPFRMVRACKQFPAPDVIYTSSPALPTSFMVMRYALKKNIPCVFEVRDLWPESIVEYRGISRNNPLIKILYGMEKWMYRKADQIIFTMEKGVNYITGKGWDRVIDIRKVHNINNGVDLEEYRSNLAAYKLEDPDLDNPDTYKAVYTGSIRQVNNIGMLINAWRKFSQDTSNKVQLLIFGKGNEKDDLVRYCAEQNITDVVFKEQVDKKYIPSILSKCDLTIMHGNSTGLMKYGASPNKLYEYLAAGKPILFTYPSEENPVEKYHCGIMIREQSVDTIAASIKELYGLNEKELEQIKNNTAKAAGEFDFTELSKKLEQVLTLAVERK